MQQTETYKLNLIETSDPFSPQALNENTQKLEEVVHEKLGEMDQRVTVLEGFKFASGVCDVPTTVELGFTPIAVFIRHIDFTNTNHHAMIVSGETSKPLEIVENGFKAKNCTTSGNSVIFGNAPYYFIAFGYK